MKETLVMSCARTVTLRSFGLLTIAAPTLRMTGAMKKCLGTPAQSVASSQTVHREAIIAGAIDVGRRCYSGRATNAWHNATVATRSSTVTRSTAGTAGTHGGQWQRVADCLCPTMLVRPRGVRGLVLMNIPGEVATSTSGMADGSATMPPSLLRHLRSGKLRRRRRRLTAAPQQRDKVTANQVAVSATELAAQVFGAQLEQWKPAG